MNLLKFAAVAALFILAIGGATANPFPHPNVGVAGVLGSDGIFRVPAVQMPIRRGTATTIVTGTLAGNITLSIASTLPANAKIQCNVSAVFFSAASNTIIQDKLVAATVNGSTATCNPQLKYRVRASTQADANFVSFSYAVIATDKQGNGRNLNPSEPASLASVSMLPPDGTTTSFTASLRI